MSHLRVGFAGTPAFAACALDALLGAGWQVPLVLTQPDRPAGRGLKPQASAVKQRALAAGLPVFQPAGLRLDGKHAEAAVLAHEALAQSRLDVLVVVAYGLLLPSSVLRLPRLGCVNIHGSLLPRWRGAAPIQRAIEAGDALSGITIIQMDEGLDTGPILATAPHPITPGTTSGQLYDTLAVLGGTTLLKVLDDLASGSASAVPQPLTDITYAARIDKAEGRLDFTQDAITLYRKILAFDPSPGTFLLSGNDRIKVGAAQALMNVSSTATPGTVLAIENAVDIACARGVLRLSTLQRPGGRLMEAARVAEALRWQVGDHLAGLTA